MFEGGVRKRTLSGVESSGKETNGFCICRDSRVEAGLERDTHSPKICVRSQSQGESWLVGTNVWFKFREEPIANSKLHPFLLSEIVNDKPEITH